jgi:DNA-binding MarR family transcriptional regulator
MSPAPPAKRKTSGAKTSAAIGQTLYGIAAIAVRRGSRDISLTAASTLSTLHRTGPRRITDLAVLQNVTQPSMTALVSALERSGWVERRTDPADKRVVLAALTANGLDYVLARRRAGADAITLLIDKLPTEESEALAGAMVALEQLLDLGEEQRDRRTLTTNKDSIGGDQ